MPTGEDLRLRVNGVNDVGDPISFVAVLPLDHSVADGEERLTKAGLTLRTDGDKVLVDDAAFDSAAKKAGLDWDQQVVTVLKPVSQPPKYLMFIPALLLLALVVWAQRGRATGQRRQEPVAA